MNEKILITVSPEAQAHIAKLIAALGRNRAAIIRAALATADPAAMAQWFASAQDIKPGKRRAA